MRSVIASLILMLPSIGMSDASQPTMVAQCQCEIVNADGMYMDARNQMPGLPGMIPLEASDFTAFGEYVLKVNDGKVTAFHSSVGDKNCSMDLNGQLNMSCIPAMAMAERRAQGNCSDNAKSYDNGSGSATGTLVAGSCVFDLQGAKDAQTAQLNQL